MGLQEVKNEIVQEAEAQAESILEEAKTEAERIRTEAEERAEEKVETAREEAENEAEQLRNKKLSSARMQAKNKRLKAREALLQKTYNRFLDEITQLDEDEEADLIESALENLDDQTDIGTVYAAETHEGLVSDYGDFEAKDIQGVIVETADGSRRFNMRFDEIAEDVIDNNKRAVSEVLFEE